MSGLLKFWVCSTLQTPSTKPLPSSLSRFALDGGHPYPGWLLRKISHVELGPDFLWSSSPIKALKVLWNSAGAQYILRFGCAHPDWSIHWSFRSQHWENKGIYNTWGSWARDWSCFLGLNVAGEGAGRQDLCACGQMAHFVRVPMDLKTR